MILKGEFLLLILNFKQKSIDKKIHHPIFRQILYNFMTKKKSILKTITHRILSTILTLGVIFAVTGSFTLAGTISVVDGILKSMLYYAHERFWIKFDREVR